MWPFKTRTITVPASNESREVEAIELWYVRWKRNVALFDKDSELGRFERCVEAFADEGVANAFAESLRQANRMLRHTCCTEVTVDKRTLEAFPGSSR